MADRRTFGEKARDTVEDVKDNITGNTYDRGCRERDCRDDNQCTDDAYGGQYRGTTAGEGINREQGVATKEIRQPGSCEGITQEPGVVGNEGRQPDTFGGQLGETGVIGGPYGETGNRREGGSYEAGERRNEL